MRCPHCKKEIHLYESAKNMREEIVSLIKKEQHTRTTLSKKLKLHMATIRYNVQKLLSEGRIIEKELKKESGKPIILIFKK